MQTSAIKLTIATRESQLAMWQAEFIKARLETLYPQARISLLGLTTKGDQILDKPLAKIGGKGLFIKELEVAMQQGQADLAVHSMKDVPMALPEGFEIAAICERHEPRDAFVSSNYQSINELPAGAVVGTSSMRRQCQLLAARPDLLIKSLRGNIHTRLNKLDNGDYDAIILAAAGLTRVGLQHRISDYLPVEQSLPAVGQGALGIEIPIGRPELRNLLKPLNDPRTAALVTAERAMNYRLQGSCEVPIAGYACYEDEGETIWLRGLVGAAPEAAGERQIITAQARRSTHEAEALGTLVAEDLLNQGASELLAAVLK